MKRFRIRGRVRKFIKKHARRFIKKHLGLKGFRKGRRVKRINYPSMSRGGIRL